MKKNLYLKALRNSSPDKLARVTRKTISDDAEITLPKNETESVLLEIFKKILNTEQLGTTVNLISAGLNSLKIVQAISLLKKQMGADLTFEDFLNNPDVASLAKVTNLSGQTDHLEIRKQADQDDYDLSHAQKRMWISHHIEGQELLFNIVTPYLIEGNLNEEALNKAVGALYNRHDSLRTNFIEKAGMPRQIVRPSGDWGRVPVRDVSEKEDPMQAALEISRQQSQVPFELTEGSLFRTILIKTGENRYVFVLVIHHLITDGLSMEVFLKDLSIFYLYFCGEKTELPDPLAIQYKDYSIWEQENVVSDSLQVHKDYWFSVFKDSYGKDRLKLPTDFPESDSKVSKSKTVYGELGMASAEYLEHFTKKHGTTFFIPLFAALNAFMHRLTGQDEVILGFPLSVRTPGLRDQIGLYINTVASKTVFQKEESFQTLMHQVRGNIVNAVKHGSYPFDLLVSDLNTRFPGNGGKSLFDVMVSFQDASDTSRIGEELQISRIEASSNASIFDLSFEFYKSTKGLMVKIDYRADLFEQDTITLFLEQLKKLIHEVYQHPEKALGLLDLEFQEGETKNDYSFDLDF